MGVDLTEAQDALTEDAITETYDPACRNAVALQRGVELSGPYQTARLGQPEARALNRQVMLTYPLALDGDGESTLQCVVSSENFHVRFLRLPGEDPPLVIAVRG